MKKKTTNKKKIKKNIPSGIVHIYSTFNNTIVTISDEKGKVVTWSSAGAMGYKGTKKSTPFVAQLVADAACKSALEHGMISVKMHVKGPGPGRDAAIRSIQNSGLNITEIRDVTPIPHNGVRPPKKPRK